MRKKTVKGWTQDDVRWQMDMAQYPGNDLYDRLEEVLMPLLADTEHLCEIGCGVGTLTLRLARMIPKITAVDKSELPMDQLFQGLLDARLRHVDTVQMDFRKLSFADNTPDTTLLHADCLTPGDLDYIRKKSCHLILMLDTSEAWPPCAEEISAGKMRLKLMEQQLEAKHIHPDRICVRGRADQPVAGRQDAIAYCMQCAPRRSRKSIRSFVEENMQSASGDEHFFVLPREREYTLLNLQGQRTEA